MINKDFFLALEDLEFQKKINKEQFIETLESALTSAYKKQFGEGKFAEVKLNPERGIIRIYSYKKIVEAVEDSDKEISLEEARKMKKSFKLGEIVTTEENTKDFGRIAAQTAKQVVMQKLKEMERAIALSDLTDKEDELMTTVVKRMDNNVVYVQIPGVNTEGVMLENDQIPGDRFKVGDRVKVYVKKIKDGMRGPQIQVSRSNIGFVRKLFELEIPEIGSGDVVIKNIARDAGNRSKVAIAAARANIDALGACVGNRGARINQIVSELNGEKVDLVPYSDDPLEYIAAALSPAKIISVETNESLKSSRVIVPDDKLSLAIGKAGSNVRLAARLTGWKIDVKAESTVSSQVVSQEVGEISDVDDTAEPADLVFDELEDLE